MALHDISLDGCAVGLPVGTGADIGSCYANCESVIIINNVSVFVKIELLHQKQETDAFLVFGCRFVGNVDTNGISRLITIINNQK